MYSEEEALEFANWCRIYDSKYPNQIWTIQDLFEKYQKETAPQTKIETSVEWLAEQLESITQDLFEQAKKMHKKQSLELIELTAQLTGVATVDSEIAKMKPIDVYNQYYNTKNPIPEKTTHALLLEFGFTKDETADIPSYFRNFGSFLEDDYEYCFCIFQDIDNNFYTQIMGKKVILNNPERLKSLYEEVTGEKIR
jgi:hypothetical protein